jgi:protein O-mannosyl-transferase
VAGASAEPGRRRRPWIGPLIVAAITVLTFLPVLSNDFVVWDDAKLLIQNRDYRGLGWPQLRWMFTTTLLGHYAPLTWLSWGLDYVVWGMNPVGYHVTNLAIHVVAVILFYRVATILLSHATALGAAAVEVGAATAALFFAVHPLRVEPVAWVTGRRDVLSGALFLLTIWLYLRAVEAVGARRRRLLALSLAAYPLALMAKTVVMTLPLVLFLLDIYPLRRLAASPRDWLPAGWPVLREKLPFAVLGVAGAVAGYLAQLVLGPQISPFANAAWIDRAANGAYSLWFHLVRQLFPTGLSALYERPLRIDPFEPTFLVSAIGVIGVTLVLCLRAARWPAGLAAWVYEACMLAPVSGIVPMGFILTADRYSYLPSLGWALLIGGGVSAGVDAARRGALRPWLARLAVGTGVVALLGLAAVTRDLVGSWRDTESLWRRAVSVDPECVLCHRYLGQALMARGEVLTALRHFQTAAALHPEAYRLRFDVASALGRLGLWSEAVAEYRTARARRPDDAGTLVRLGAALHTMGAYQAAVDELRAALRIAPDNAEVRVTLGRALMDLGHFAEAAEHFRHAATLEPEYAPARLGLVRAYKALDKRSLAREEYVTLRALDPLMAATLESDSFLTE